MTFKYNYNSNTNKAKKSNHHNLTKYDRLGDRKRILPENNAYLQIIENQFSVVKLESHGILATTKEFLEITATYIEEVYGDYQLER